MRAPHHLRCEYQHRDFHVIGETVPRFSWQVPVGERRGAAQTAYRIQVVDPDRGFDAGEPLWDSGEVASSRSHLVPYAGARLRSRQRCRWRVRIRDERGGEGPWSAARDFELGLLRASDWKAKWIGDERPTSHRERTPPACLRRAFRLDGAPRDARLYASAQGLFEIRCNGRVVGDERLSPGWTDYRERLPYRVYDLTDHLVAGDNVLAATLADGWYCGCVAWHEAGFYGSRPRLLAQLEFVDGAGRRRRVVSDRRWRVGEGAVRFADLLHGEHVDAAAEPGGWDRPGFDDAGWHEAIATPRDARPLVLTSAPPVRITDEFAPRTVERRDDGRHVVDFGQNLVGHLRLRLPAETPAGTEVVLRHAEVLDERGELYVANLRAAEATDRYRAAGGAAVFEPRFTFHGFRYAEIAGFPGELRADDLRAVVIGSDCAPTGRFECGHDLVNRLQANIDWGQRGNFVEIPTDCPQRDERLGWTGDIQVFAATAAFNRDVDGFLAKWCVDLADSQGAAGAYPDVAPDVLTPEGKEPPNTPGWGDAGLIVPWVLWTRYGDRRVVERQYPSMKASVEFQLAESPGHRRTREGYGDWLNMSALTSYDVIATAFLAHACDLLARFAAILDKKGDARRYRAAFERTRKAFNDHFVTREGRVVGDTQTAYVLALRFGLLPEALHAKAVARLVWDLHEGRWSRWPYPKRKGHLSTGFLGVNHLQFALSEHGRTEEAFALLLQEDFPSWLFPVKHGATTIWERWDGWTPDGGFQDPEMNSFNHYAYGAIGQWCYEVLAGLRTAEDEDGVGYRRLILEPRWPTGDAGRALGRARAELRTPYGVAASGWELAGDEVVATCRVPANTTAELRLPVADPGAVVEEGLPLDRVPGVAGVAPTREGIRATLAPGDYRFALPAG